MVDCRTAGAPPQDINGSSPDNHAQQSGGGDMSNSVSSSARASTPATTNAITTYTSMNPGAGSAPALTTMPSNVPYNCGPYVCGVKSVVWCAPHSPPHVPHAPHVPHVPHVPHAPHVPPPPPHGVNPHVYKSVQANGADLPMNDIATLRYYFNLGVECMWAAYGPQPPHHAPHPHHPHHPPPRHYSPAAVAQDLQQMSLHERPPSHGHDKLKSDKLAPPPKGAPQRPLLGPRFKRGNNQDNNQSNNHNQNKGHNNNMNKGPNNRRNSYIENRAPYEDNTVNAGSGVVEAPLLTFPYAPYPPPIYPLPYYHIEEPAMMGMMSGMNAMGYVYEEGMEFGVQPVYGAPYPPPHVPHAPPHPHPHPAHTPHTPHTPHVQPLHEHK